MSIAFKEGLKITPPVLQEIILASHQDIRQVIIIFLLFFFFHLTSLTMCVASLDLDVHNDSLFQNTTLGFNVSISFSFR